MNNLIYDYETVQKLLIKSLIAESSSIPEITQSIIEDDFSNVKYRNIFVCIKNLFFSGTQISTAEIYKEMLKMGTPLIQEDLELFSDPPIDSPQSLASILMRESVEHKLNKLSNELSTNLSTKKYNTLDLMGEFQTEVEELSFRLTDNKTTGHKEMVDNFFTDALSNREEDAYFIPSPYETLNGYINGGWMPGKMITIGARTGKGKTVFAVQSAAAACAAGKSVLYFSLEMSGEELMKRLAACYGGILLKHLEPQHGRSEEVLHQIKEVRKEIRNWKLTIDDESDVTMDYIRSKALQKAQSNDGLDFIIIDYLQLISMKGSKGRSRQEEVAEISRMCKILAKKLQIPIMILVQLNRESKDEDEERLPSKADIRESAAIAADSDIVIIIHRKNRDDSTDPRALFILDKNRGGPADKMIYVRSILEKSIFQDIRTERHNSQDQPTEEQISKFTNPQNSIEGFGNPNDLIIDENEWGNDTINNDGDIEMDDLFDYEE